MNLTMASKLDLRIWLPASIAATEEFYCSFRRQHGCMCRNGEHFVAELILREALTNAVLHGSKADASKQIYCHIRRRGSNLTMIVRDQGEGFDWRSRSGREACSTAVSGRGVEIFRRYATRYRYNATGNCLAIWKKFEEETKYD